MRQSLFWKLAALLLTAFMFGGLITYPALAHRYQLPAPEWLLNRRLKLGLDISGGVQLLLRVSPSASADSEATVAVDELVDHTRQTVLRRIDALGVMEPTVVQYGGRGSDRLLVELPGVTDVERAKAVIGSTGVLEFRLANAPARPAVITGADLRSAQVTADDYGLPAVNFTLSNDAGARFSVVTADNIGQPLAVILDGKVQSVATIEARIGTDGQIRGQFTPQQAEDLAAILRAGALPADITYLRQHTIGASLGRDSIRAGLTASLAGLAAVAAFMMAWYRWWGVNATLVLAFNVLILVGLLAYLEAFLTLPGIAGLILTIGMGVDSNILIFERVRDELAAGRSRRAAVDAAFRRVFRTLVDTHVAALVAAGCLFQFGAGPIRGFAVTLTLGLVANLFTSTFVSKTLFEVMDICRSSRPRYAGERDRARAESRPSSCIVSTVPASASGPVSDPSSLPHGRPIEEDRT
jgi:protein-export SecD/SecF family membrane protein